MYAYILLWLYFASGNRARGDDKVYFPVDDKTQQRAPITDFKRKWTTRKMCVSNICINTSVTYHWSNLKPARRVREPEIWKVRSSFLSSWTQTRTQTSDGSKLKLFFQYFYKQKVLFFFIFFSSKEGLQKMNKFYWSCGISLKEFIKGHFCLDEIVIIHKLYMLKAFDSTVMIALIMNE